MLSAVAFGKRYNGTKETSTRRKGMCSTHIISFSPLLLLTPRSLSPPQRKLAVPSPLFAKAFLCFPPLHLEGAITARRERQHNKRECAHYPFASFAVDPAFPFVATAETRISRAPLRTFAKRFALSLSPRPEKSLNQRGMRLPARHFPGSPQSYCLSLVSPGKGVFCRVSPLM